jgi:uncharacterized protein
VTHSTYRLGFIAAAALLAAAQPAHADVKAGVDAWSQRNYTGAVAQWRPLADRGDADAQFNMGQAYKLGRGVPQDLKIARSWFEKAAQQGHEKAQVNLGLILFQGGERKAAMPWIEKAAGRGDARAQYVLGTAHFNGDFAAKNWPLAYALMTRSAAQGLPNAATSLTEMDKHIPAEQRKQGVQLAREMEAKGRGAVAPSRPPASAAALEAVAPAPKAKAPAPAPAPKASAPAPKAAAPAPAAGGRWRVQLGAYGSVEAARGQWAAIAKKVPSLASLQPSYEAAGKFTRLRVGPLSDRAAADRVCAAAKAAGQACFTVAP